MRRDMGCCDIVGYEAAIYDDSSSLPMECIPSLAGICAIRAHLRHLDGVALRAWRPKACTEK
jgi:hypothetical protein